MCMIYRFICVWDRFAIIRCKEYGIHKKEAAGKERKGSEQWCGSNSVIGESTSNKVYHIHEKLINLLLRIR